MAPEPAAAAPLNGAGGSGAALGDRTLSNASPRSAGSTPAQSTHSTAAATPPPPRAASTAATPPPPAAAATPPSLGGVPAPARAAAPAVASRAAAGRAASDESQGARACAYGFPYGCPCDICTPVCAGTSRQSARSGSAGASSGPRRDGLAQPPAAQQVRAWRYAFSYARPLRLMQMPNAAEARVAVCIPVCAPHAAFA